MTQPGSVTDSERARQQEQRALTFLLDRGITGNTRVMAEFSTQENASLREELLNLLAVIHRDGGHYVAERGIEKAGVDAERIVLDLRAKLAEAERRIQELRESLVLLYDRYENGEPCFDYTEAGEKGDALGNAISLSPEEEDQILAAITPGPTKGGKA